MPPQNHWVSLDGPLLLGPTHSECTHGTRGVPHGFAVREKYAFFGGGSYHMGTCFSAHHYTVEMTYMVIRVALRDQALHCASMCLPVTNKRRNLLSRGCLRKVRISFVVFNNRSARARVFFTHLDRLTAPNGFHIFR